MAKKKPKIRMIREPMKLTGMLGNSHMNTTTSRQTTRTTFMEISCSVRSTPVLPLP